MAKFFKPRAGGKRSLGRTLLEIIVASFIFGLLSLALTLLIRNMTHLVRKNELLLELQGECLAASTWLSNDVNNTNPDLFVDETGYAGGGGGPGPVTLPIPEVGSGVIFAVPQNADGEVEVDASGRLMWRGIVAFYITEIDGVPTFVRRFKEMPATSEQPTVPTLASFHGDATTQLRVVARHVLEFRGDPDPAPPFEYTLVFQRIEVPDFSIEASNSAFFRNQ